MNVKLLVALAMLVVWAVVALVFQGPGWVHLLLTGGVSLLIYSVVTRNGSPPAGPDARR